MAYRTNSNKRAQANRKVSEYIWDPNTKRYRRNPDFKRSKTVSYLVLIAIILIVMVFTAWYLTLYV
jgi:hypothetical protein